VIEALEPSVLSDENEGRRSRIVRARVEQVDIVGGNEQADEEQSKDIEAKESNG
jgi:hypothetical protein